MKTKEFIIKIQNYYGQKYREGEHIELVYKYLNNKNENYLKCLFVATVKNFSGQFKTLPDIAVFEKLKNETYEIIDEQRRKNQIQNLKTKAITDGDEIDRSDEIADLLFNLKESIHVK